MIQLLTVGDPLPRSLVLGVMGVAMRLGPIKKCIENNNWCPRECPTHHPYESFYNPFYPNKSQNQKLKPCNKKPKRGPNTPPSTTTTTAAASLTSVADDLNEENSVFSLLSPRLRKHMCKSTCTPFLETRYHRGKVEADLANPWMPR